MRFKTRLLSGLLLLSFMNTAVMAKTVTLEEGSVMELILREQINSQTAQEGAMVKFEVYDDLQVDDKHTVIKAGTPAWGQLTHLEKKGAFGKPGDLILKLDRTRAVDGTTVYLRGGSTKKGDGKRGLGVGLPLVSLVIFWPLAFFALKKGKDAVIPAGTRIKASVDKTIGIVLP